MNYLFKICFTMKSRNASFGGGNQFLNNFLDYLSKKPVKIVHDLSDDDIDIIFIMDPRILSLNKISLDMVKKYKETHPNILVIHRINDSDRARDQKGFLDPIILDALTTVDDHPIFVSEYIKNYYIKQGYSGKTNVIFNGCNTNVFYPDENKNNDKIRIVTHHWSTNNNKGYDFYDIVDKYIDTHPELEFVFIGKGYNEHYKPKNIKIIGPYHGQELGNELRKCHLYITGSRFDACPMHVVEALACGLPMLYYIDLGGGTEICNSCGESFKDENELITKLEYMIKNLDKYKNKTDYKQFSSDICNDNYYNHIITLLLTRKYNCSELIIHKPMWLKRLLLWCIKIEECNYIWSLNGYDDFKLGSVGLFAKLASMFRNYYDFDKEKIKNIINSYKIEDNMFKNIEKEIIGESRQALSGLINLQLDFDIPKTDQYFDSHNLFFMNDTVWKNPWSAGANLSHYIFFMNLQNKEKEINNVLKQLNKYKHNDGWYFTEHNKHINHHYRINGIMKIFTGFDVIGKEIDKALAKNILESLLNVDDSFGGCGIYDYVYVVTKCMDFVDDQNLLEKCKEKLLNIFDIILLHQQEDGGFKYDIKNDKAHKYYGENITPDGMIGTIHGTTLFCMALSRLNLWLDLNLNIRQIKS